jgi:hypothetical protein
MVCERRLGDFCCYFVTRPTNVLTNTVEHILYREVASISSPTSCCSADTELPALGSRSGDPDETMDSCHVDNFSWILYIFRELI